MIVAPLYSLGNLTTYFLKLGTTGFGGPVALVVYMHRDLVEKRKWISEDEYKEGLALSQSVPVSSSSDGHDLSVRRRRYGLTEIGKNKSLN